jgi:hypothetical protein
MLACKGDTFPALLEWFYHDIDGISNLNSDFYFTLTVITLITMALMHR